MPEQRRRELTESSQLAVHDEGWLLRDCLLAVVGFVGWVAATGALTALGAREAGLTLALGTGSTRTLAVLAGAVVAWILLPALAATLRLRGGVTNVSGNVESQYRFEVPGTLLWPPAALLAIALVAALVSPLAWPAYALAFVAGAHLLVRTAAFSYRVFAFSHPLLVHLASFVTFSLYAATGVVQLGAVAGAQETVRDATAVLGVPIDVYGSVGPSVLSVPILMTVAAVTPAVLVAVYLLAQSLAAVYVRYVEPEVDRSSLRAGQRNPFREVAANGAGPAASGGRSRPAGPGQGDDRQVPVHVQTTRVYDPESEVDDPAGIDTSAAGSPGPECRTCHASFSPGTEVRFCPNCGQRLDDG
jgi:hypothetical protein